MRTRVSTATALAALVVLPLTACSSGFGLDLAVDPACIAGATQYDVAVTLTPATLGQAHVTLSKDEFHAQHAHILILPPDGTTSVAVTVTAVGNAGTIAKASASVPVTGTGKASARIDLGGPVCTSVDMSAPEEDLIAPVDLRHDSAVIDSARELDSTAPIDLLLPTCAALVAAQNLSSPLCDKTGSGVCMGAGGPSSDCLRCCDATQTTCGSVSKANGWSDFSCDKTGLPTCPSGSTASMECTACCRKPKWTLVNGGANQTLTRNDLQGVWGSGPSDVYAVGSTSPDTGTSFDKNTAVLHSTDGKTFAAERLPSGTSRCTSVTGVDASTVFIGVDGGDVFLRQNNKWTLDTTLAVPAGYLDLFAVSVSSAFAVDGMTVNVRRAGSWSAGTGVGQVLHGVWANSTRTYVIDDQGSVYASAAASGLFSKVLATNGSYLGGIAGAGTHVAVVGSVTLAYDGNSWSMAALPPKVGTLLAVWLSATGVGVAVGVGAAVLRTRDFGATWVVDTTLPDGLVPMCTYQPAGGPALQRPCDLQGVWAVDERDVWVVGDHGTILHDY